MPTTAPNNFSQRLFAYVHVMGRKTVVVLPRIDLKDVHIRLISIVATKTFAL